MTIDIVARTTPAAMLKAGLDRGAANVREIADRIANASTPAFSVPGDSAAPSAAPVDVEAEMARLADEQARYEATARLLEKVYAGLRAGMHE